MRYSTQATQLSQISTNRRAPLRWWNHIAAGPNSIAPKKRWKNKRDQFQFQNNHEYKVCTKFVFLQFFFYQRLDTIRSIFILFTAALNRSLLLQPNHLRSFSSRTFYVYQHFSLLWFFLAKWIEEGHIYDRSSHALCNQVFFFFMDITNSHYLKHHFASDFLCPCNSASKHFNSNCFCVFDSIE